MWLSVCLSAPAAPPSHRHGWPDPVGYSRLRAMVGTALSSRTESPGSSERREVIDAPTNSTPVASGTATACPRSCRVSPRPRRESSTIAAGRCASGNGKQIGLTLASAAPSSGRLSVLIQLEEVPRIVISLDLLQTSIILPIGYGDRVALFVTIEVADVPASTHERTQRSV
jgi:hypothetical protein